MNSLALIAVLFALAFQIYAFGEWFYRFQFRQNDTYSVLRMDEENLHHVARDVIALISGRLDTLAYTTAVVDGQERLFFNESEVCHMEDVRVLFHIGLIARNISYGVFAGTLLLLLLTAGKTGRRAVFSKIMMGWRCFAAGFLTGLAVLALLIVIDFDRAFVIFHEIFFVDNWTFNPRTSLMINMLPNPFFQSISAFIGATYAAFLAVVIAVTFVLRKTFKVRHLS